MILTGKAKKDFIKWLYFKHNLQPYNLFNEIIQYALIIEWFDSVEIYITFDYFDLNKCFYSEILNYSSFSTVGTRQECAKNSILKANEIYNSK